MGRVSHPCALLQSPKAREQIINRIAHRKAQLLFGKIKADCLVEIEQADAAGQADRVIEQWHRELQTPALSAGQQLHVLRR
jgi:hypothetical protein